MSAGDIIEDRWRNRRRMAWACMWASLIYPLLALTADGGTLAQIAVPFYAFTGAVVAVYIGGVVVDDKWQRSSP